MGKFSLSLFFFSLAIPQFGLLSHISSLRLSSGHLGLVLTLSNTAGTSLFSPCLLLAVVRIWATSPLGVAVRCVVCGFFVFPFSSQLCCPLRFKTLHRPASERVSWCLETFPPSQLPPLDGSLFSLFLSFIFSLFIFYILSYLLLKRTGCLFGRLVSSCQHSEVVLWNLLSVQMIFR